MKALRYLIYFILFIYFILLFLPKANLYYKFEEILSKKDIYINHEQIDTKPLGLDIKNADILFGDEKIGYIKKVSIDIYLFLDTISIKNTTLKLNSIKYLPKKIDTITLSYSILKPKIISIDIAQKEVSYKGYYDLFTQKLVLTAKIPNNKKIQNKILNYFKKSKKGIYKYEKTIKLY